MSEEIRAPRIEAMGSADSAWLHMDEPTNLMMVTGILYFDEPMAKDRLARALEHGMVRYRRFRQRVIDADSSVNPPRWEEDANFHLDNHLTEITLPEPGDKETLERKVSELVSRPLDFDHPLWHMYLIQNCETGSALFIRIHHCIADGIALVSVLLAMTADTPEDSMRFIYEKDEKEPTPKDLIKALFPRTSKLFKTATKFTKGLLQEGTETVRDPSRLSTFLKFGVKGAKTLTNLLAQPADPVTMLKGKLGYDKCVAWSRALPLSDIKAIRRATNSTVNDVLLAAMAGGIRRYLVRYGEQVGGLNVRAVIPVNLRKPEHMGQLSNHFGLVYLALPIGIPDPEERLEELKKRMNKIKRSPEAFLTLGLLKIMGSLPSAIQRLVINEMGTKATTIMTNVPGPQKPLYFAGNKLDTLLFWVPQSGRLGLGISIFSYNNTVRVGVMSDKGIVPNPSEIVDSFYLELDAMMNLIPKEEDSEE